MLSNVIQGIVIHFNILRKTKNNLSSHSLQFYLLKILTKNQPFFTSACEGIKNRIMSKKGLPKYWTDEERERLKQLYPTTLGADLSKIFNCPLHSIYNQANRLGLKKEKAFIAEIARQRTLDPNHGGKKYQFKKGTIPPNKGQKQIEFMSLDSIERTKATRFKKGNVPLNHRLVGSERFDKDGYIMVKVADPSKWKLKHRYIWEKANGKVPKGCNIQFKDGNRLNISLENLYMINRKDQMNQNSIVRYPSEVRTAIKRISKINKLIKQ